MKQAGNRCVNLDGQNNSIDINLSLTILDFFLYLVSTEFFTNKIINILISNRLLCSNRIPQENKTDGFIK